MEKTVAEASVGTIYGENVELQDYFDWCLEHQLSEDVIQEGIMKYRTDWQTPSTLSGTFQKAFAICKSLQFPRTVLGLSLVHK